MNLTRFTTLLHREWMQHHKGWLLSMLLLPVIFLLVLPFGHAELAPDSERPTTVQLALAAAAITVIATFCTTWLVTTLQLPGLPRRDVQDRSVEFWLSLPGTHTESLSAPLLTHAILVPMLAVLAGAVMSLPMSMAVLAKFEGAQALGQVNWGTALSLVLALSVRLLVGIVLFSLWMAPIYLAFMAASAWLKRLGVPALIAAWVIIGNVLEKLYQNPIVWQLTQAQLDGAGHALLVSGKEDPKFVLTQMAEPGYGGQLLSWLAEDIGLALGQLASVHLVGGLLVAGGCFYLLILHRQRAH